jgi:ABC-type ATPase involved in cell division
MNPALPQGVSDRDAFCECYAEAMLACIGVAKIFGKTRALSSVSFGSEPGGCICIVGEGGSGKSALMRLLLGLDHPSEGRIEVDGVDLRILPAPVLQLYRGKVGAIFQEPGLLSRLTLEENLAYPLAVRGAAEQAMAKETNAMLGRIGLAGKGALLPSDLSPSERAMASIGRALIAKPMIILADEPLAPLDSEQSDIALEMLKEAHHRGASLILFSQGASLAHRLGASVLPLKDGRIEAEMPKKTAKHSPAHVQAEEHETSREHPNPAKHMMKAEKEEKPAVPVHAHAKQEHPAKEPGGKGKKKIRITQIGS